MLYVLSQTTKKMKSKNIWEMLRKTHAIHKWTKTWSTWRLFKIKMNFGKAVWRLTHCFDINKRSAIKINDSIFFSTFSILTIILCLLFFVLFFILYTFYTTLRDHMIHMMVVNIPIRPSIWDSISFLIPCHSKCFMKGLCFRQKINFFSTNSSLFQTQFVHFQNVWLI